jgi:hypothetical protein
MKFTELIIILIAVICVKISSHISIKTDKKNTTNRSLLANECSNYVNNHKILAAESANKAKLLLSRFPTEVPISNRLAVMILFSRGFSSAYQHKNRLEFLHCAITKLLRNLQNTSIDVFIWTLNTTEVMPDIPNWLSAKNFPRINVMEIPVETWKIPCGLIDDSEWAVRKHFDIDYYLMGRWRLTFSLDFAKEMGYAYHLQFDDDAMLNNKIEYDVVQSLKEKTIDMAVFSDLIGEVPQVVLGLPELTNFWIKSNKFTPVGSLFKHLNPPNILGLTSEGWDRMYHPGYFLIISLDFWFEKNVQSYLTTVLRSGRDIEARWQEQAVINMIRLVFVVENKLLVMNDVDVGHDRHKKANFEQWCVREGIVMTEEKTKI